MDNDTSMRLQILCQTISDSRTCNIIIGMLRNTGGLSQGLTGISVAFLALAAYDIVICFSDEVSAISTVIHIATDDVFNISVVLYGMHNGRRYLNGLLGNQTTIPPSVMAGLDRRILSRMSVRLFSVLPLTFHSCLLTKGLMALRTYALYSGRVFVKWCIISLLVAELVSLLELFVFITRKVACNFIWITSCVCYLAARSSTLGNDNFEPVLDFRASSPYLTCQEQSR
ncbi:hypothetical protein ACEPAI_8618 [Sanghuangporus weigelae]